MRCLAWSPDGKVLASGGRDETIRVWDVANERQSLELRGIHAEVEALVVSRDGLRLFSGTSLPYLVAK